MTSVLVIGDTHIHSWDSDIHPALKTLLSEADIAVHCGDWVSFDAVEGFQRDTNQSIFVSGNSDPPDLRQAIPYVDILEVHGIRIGITHPAWAGPEPELGELLDDFPEAQFGKLDIICYGHTHVPEVTTHRDVTFINGGQGYPSLFVPGTYAYINVEDTGEFTATTHEFAPGL